MITKEGIRKEIEGSFNTVYSPEQINAIVAEFLNGRFEVKITAGEFRDALAYMFGEGLDDH